MKQEEFRDAILTRRDFDFVYNNRRFIINTKQMPDGSLNISFGEEYTVPVLFDSFTHLMADAKIDFKYLREVLVDIK